MPDLLDRIRREINDRLKELRPSVDEHARLLNAIAALGPTTRARATGRPRARPRPRTTSPSPTKPMRAPRGDAQQAIVDYLAAHGAGTAGDIAGSTSLSRTSIAATLSRLTRTGTLTKVDRGYRLADTPPTGS